MYTASPTITFKGKEKARPQSYEQALEAGEVYVFKKERRAERFAAGSWKKGKDKRDAMRAYRKKKRAEKREIKHFNLYGLWSHLNFKKL